MLYKNCTSKVLTFAAGDGPGRVVNYTAKPGAFVEGPDGYRAPFKRHGFTPVDELPATERPNIEVSGAKPGFAPVKHRRPVFDVNDDSDGDGDVAPVPAGFAAVQPLPDLPPAAPVVPAGYTTGVESALSAVAKLSATGTMTVVDDKAPTIPVDDKAPIPESSKKKNK